MARTLTACFCLTVTLGWCVTTARAALISDVLIVEVTSLDPGVEGIAVGDRFVLHVTFDDQDTDTNASVGTGSFPGLVTGFFANAYPGNVGTWDPSDGVFDAAASNFVTNAFGDNFTLQVRGTGFPSSAGLPFHDFDLGFAWTSGIDDSGAGDTFAEQLGLAEGAFELAQADFGTFSEIRFVNGLDFPAAHLTVASFVPGITWRWSFDTEAGTFVTTGELDEFGNAPAGTYTIVDFTVTDSVDPSLLGSLSGGEFYESQPTQGFVWNGAMDTQWFRSDGHYTNGSNFFSSIKQRAYGFFPGSYTLYSEEPHEEYASSTTLTLPEPSSELGALAALVVLALLRRRTA